MRYLLLLLAALALAGTVSFAEAARSPTLPHPLCLLVRIKAPPGCHRSCYILNRYGGCPVCNITCP